MHAIEDNINAKYANKVRNCLPLQIIFEWIRTDRLLCEKVIQKVGLCICLYDLQWASEGLIGHGEGSANVNGIFCLPLPILCFQVASNVHCTDEFM